jgi:hypothetical protein
MIAHPASLAKSSNEKFAKKSLIFQHLYHQTSKKRVSLHLPKQNQVVREKLRPKMEKLEIILKTKSPNFPKISPYSFA